MGELVDHPGAPPLDLRLAQDLGADRPEQLQQRGVHRALRLSLGGAHIGLQPNEDLAVAGGLQALPAHRSPSVSSGFLSSGDG